MRGADGAGASTPDRQRADGSTALRPLPPPAEPAPPLALDPARASASALESTGEAASSREAPAAPHPGTGAPPGKRARGPDGAPEADRAQKRPRMRGQPGDAARRFADGAASPDPDPGGTREGAGGAAANEAQAPLSNGADMAAAAAAVRRAGAAGGVAGARVSAKLKQLLQAVQVRAMNSRCIRCVPSVPKCL